VAQPSSPEAGSAPSRNARLLVSCGEASGDLYAAELLRHLRSLGIDVSAFGLGGDRLQAEGTRLAAHVRDLAVVGLAEVLRHLPRLRRTFRDLLALTEAERPDLAVLVDYPDFNLRLARALRRRRVPVVYYVSPQVWAWRRGRVRAIRETVDHMIVIFPFEEPLYRAAGVPVTFVGHPLVELVRPPRDAGEFLRSQGLDPMRPVLAILPGSRRQEVAHNLPPIAEALALVRQRRPDVQPAVAVAPSLPSSILEPLRLAGARLVEGHTHALLGAARAGIVASGTATVEAALVGLPIVVVYRLSALTYALGKPFVRVRHYAMPNLVAGREVVHELIQSDFTGDSVAREILPLLEDGTRRDEVRRGLAEVREQLGGEGASRRAAEAVAARLGFRSKKD
jgi:lipid-A-disaccharide synthase